MLTVAFDQTVLHCLVDHLFCALDDLVHGQGQVRPIQLVVDLPGAALQHVLQTAVLHHSPVAEDGGDAAGLQFLTWRPNTRWRAARDSRGRALAPSQVLGKLRPAGASVSPPTKGTAKDGELA